MVRPLQRVVPGIVFTFLVTALSAEDVLVFLDGARLQVKA
jgi:hypothetical protein